MSEYIVATKDVGDLRVEVVHDATARDYDTFFGDAPFALFGYSRGSVNVLHDSSKAIQFPRDWYALVADGESDELALQMFEHDADYEDCANGEDTYEGWSDLGEKRFRLKALALIARCGSSFHSGQDGTYYALWDKAEVAAWSGSEGFTIDLSDWYDGNVWGYRVVRPELDDDGYEVDAEDLESCWGFVGDWEHCMSEGVAVAESIISEEKAHADAA